MPNFLIDLTGIPGPKIQWDDVSGPLAQPLMWCSSADYNTIRQALFDLRAWALTGLTPGTISNVVVTIDANGRITDIASGTPPPAPRWDVIVDMTAFPISFGAAYDAWNVGTLGENTLIKAITDGTPTGNSSRSLRGVAGGSAGKTITILNMAPSGVSGVIDCANETGTAGSAFHNAGGGSSNGGANGAVSYVHDGTLWRMTGKTQ